MVSTVLLVRQAVLCVRTVVVTVVCCLRALNSHRADSDNAALCVMKQEPSCGFIYLAGKIYLPIASLKWLTGPLLWCWAGSMGIVHASTGLGEAA